MCIVNNGKIALHTTPQLMKQRLHDRYLMVDAVEPDRLKAELTQRGIPFSANGGGVKIPYTEATPQALIAQLETPLSLLNVHEPSLEEAYVNLIGAAS